MSAPLRTVMFWVAIATLPVFPFVLIGGVFYLLYQVNACITEVRQDNISRSGLKFQITETDCSTLGEDASISVYGLNETGPGRTLLFKYGPASDDLPLPEIAVSSRNVITITVPIVADIFSQLARWNNHAISYDIGHIDYPSPEGTPDR